jgi:hypothetical protein
VLAKRRTRSLGVAAHERGENLVVLREDALIVPLVADRDEIEAHAMVVQTGEEIGERPVARRRRHGTMEFEIGFHEMLGIAGLGDTGNAVESLAHDGEFAVRRTQRGERGDFGLNHQACLDHLHRRVAVDGLHHDAAARHDLDQALGFEPVDREMHRRSPDAELPADLGRVDLLAGFIDGRHDAPLDLAIGAVLQG